MRVYNLTGSAALEWKNAFGNTALHLAAARGTRIPIILRMVATGFDCSALNDLGQTPADVARETGHALQATLLDRKLEELQLAQQAEQAAAALISAGAVQSDVDALPGMQADLAVIRADLAVIKEQQAALDQQQRFHQQSTEQSTSEQQVSDQQVTKQQSTEQSATEASMTEQQCTKQQSTEQQSIVQPGTTDADAASTTVTAKTPIVAAVPAADAAGSAKLSNDWQRVCE